MTKNLDLDAMEKLEMAMSRAPWRWEGGSLIFDGPLGPEHVLPHFAGLSMDADGKGIAAARSFVPLAIERIRELEKQRDDLQAANTVEVERRRKVEAWMYGAPERKVLREGE